MPFIRKYIYHFLAIATVIIWGTTFVSTKILIFHGLSAAEIMIYRFIIAYFGICLLAPKKLFANNFRDELLFIGMGLFGGSLYFLLENTALEITLASNVSLIICTVPILTAFVVRIFYPQEKISKQLILGFFIAMIGLCCVVFNGSFILKISPFGDVLTFLAALSWAFYSVILRRMNHTYSTSFITRKVFIYGILTMLPYTLAHQQDVHLHLLLTDKVIMGHLIYLGVAASLICYLTWNSVVKELGVVKVSNYLYLTPLVTLATSALVIDEHITPIAIIGALITLLGVYVAERRKR